MLLPLACLAFISDSGAPEQWLRLPSGASAIPLDLIVEEGVQRVRMIGQGLTQDVAGYQRDPKRLFTDMQDICTRHVASASVPEGTNVVVTLMDKEVQFGLSDPSVIQYFESFVIRDGLCALDETEFLH
ncbi:MAG: hypothetical protein HLUCCA05_07715 [Roseibaca calidilacus]|uniref:Uncharacterized protein n=1 Tax=Roseibaca calidilacus TaxID=1666912 RepID=A0A0N8K6W1_9RHOB|nr:DUF6497 family protein [Roseibaca calidilacus]KPP90041.1 MAG: hypothetical protein HLUCCA05_07715 [Roseibaca calidilacus]CUX81146.1 hypothetical protein Ga0058931_1585 [Roseibaca calidilacus]